jgi:hypothetical protein
MRSIRFRPSSFLVVASAFVLAGCGGSGKDSANGSADSPEARAATEDLKRLGLAFHNCNDSLRRGPKDPQELAPFLENDAKLVDQLKPGGKYVFHWGLSIPSMKQGTSNTILAYLKNPIGGGKHLVLMGDAFVKTLDDAEFKEKLKAQGN